MVAIQDRERAKALIKEAIDHYSKYLKKLGISHTHLQLEIDQQLMKLQEVNREIKEILLAHLGYSRETGS